MSDPKTVAQRTDRMIDRMLGGDRLALARLITQVENRTAALPAIMKTVYPRAHGAYVVGVTGPPGAGKSTVVDRDRKSTRLNSSHSQISYAVFCLHKKTS